MDLNLKVEKEFLPFVNKPGRYIGNEYNVTIKDASQVDVRVALAFPDVYELGMSYVGFDILYHVLNSQPEIWAERVYAPWFDGEEVLREKNIPLFSLESRTSLADFDWIGFTLQYELTYSNILNMLSLAGIPLRSKDRHGKWPLVVGGGPSTYNPEPLAEFFDAFLLGDGEEAVLDICRIIQAGKKAGKNREEILQELKVVAGLYIPEFYEVEVNQYGDFQKLVPRQADIPPRIQKRILPALEGKNYSIKPLVPLIETTHDRLSLEIMRGCTEGCRFCNAGMIYRPVRERPVEDIIHQSREAIQNSGFSELSLLSLNTSDYTDLHWLMLKEKMLLAEERLSFTFPSLRLDGLTSDMVDFVKTFKKAGFTFAPEAGSQRLRNVINKNIQEKDLLDALKLVLDHGWNLVKFYFMIGLPTEKEEDLQAIVDLMKKCLSVASVYKDVNFNVSISPFSPKPHTPFQWEKQEFPEELERKSRFLLGKLPTGRVSVSWRDGYTSSLETIFNRGGRELAGVLEESWRNGARFDGWKEGFDWNRWENAFKSRGIDWKKYLRPLSVSLALPWDHLDMGISKQFLQKEKLRAYEGRSSADCRDAVCLGCGLQRKDFEKLVDCYQDSSNQTGKKISQDPRTVPVQSFGRSTRRRADTTPPVKKKLRLRFTKTGLTRFLSHLDVVRLFDRAARRAKISLVYSQGFHPRPKMAFGPPLSLGVGSVAEYVDLEAEMGSEGDIQTRLNDALPAGIQILTWKTVFSKIPSLSAAINRQVYETYLENLVVPEEWVTEFLNQSRLMITRQVKDELKELDLRPFIHHIGQKNQKMSIVLDSIEGRSAKITEVLHALLDPHQIDQRALYTQRTEQFIVDGDQITDPLQVIG
ncbi:MAG: TIGR03960 family B12-binding radical SAM protein [bacterium]|nr:MAG: TIGR03960 family B12-binding radical SAM protein [bacterium]